MRKRENIGEVEEQFDRVGGEAFGWRRYLYALHGQILRRGPIELFVLFHVDHDAQQFGEFRDLL